MSHVTTLSICSAWQLWVFRLASTSTSTRQPASWRGRLTWTMLTSIWTTTTSSPRLSQAASSGSSAVVIPTTNVGSGQQTNPHESPSKEEEEQDTTSLQSFKSRRHYRHLSFVLFRFHEIEIRGVAQKSWRTWFLLFCRKVDSTTVTSSHKLLSYYFVFLIHCDQWCQ